MTPPFEHVRLRRLVILAASLRTAPGQCGSTRPGPPSAEPQRPIKGCFAALCVALLAIDPATAAETVTPTQVLTRIRTDGARATLEALHGRETSWRDLLAGIATGRAAWLEVANALHAVSDAGASEQLGAAVGEALARQPSNVLALSLGEFGLTSICSGPDVDDVRFDAYDRSMAAIADRQRALRGVGAASLVSARDSCIASLEDSKRAIAHFFGIAR